MLTGMLGAMVSIDGVAFMEDMVLMEDMAMLHHTGEDMEATGGGRKEKLTLLQNLLLMLMPMLMLMLTGMLGVMDSIDGVVFMEDMVLMGDMEATGVVDNQPETFANIF